MGKAEGGGDASKTGTDAGKIGTDAGKAEGGVAAGTTKGGATGKAKGGAAARKAEGGTTTATVEWAAGYPGSVWRDYYHTQCNHHQSIIQPGTTLWTNYGV